MQKYKIIYLHIHTYIVLSSYLVFALYIYIFILSFILPPYFSNFLSFILDFYARSYFIYIYI